MYSAHRHDVHFGVSQGGWYIARLVLCSNMQSVVVLVMHIYLQVTNQLQCHDEKLQQGSMIQTLATGTLDLFGA